MCCKYLHNLKRKRMNIFIILRLLLKVLNCSSIHTEIRNGDSKLSTVSSDRRIHHHN